MGHKIISASTPESADLIVSFLNMHGSGVLSTSDDSGDPYSAAVYYAMQDDYSLKIATKTATQKYMNISENKQAAFVVYEEKEQVEVQITGHVEIIKDPDEIHRVVSFMYSIAPKVSFTVVPPPERLVASGYAALRLVPEVIKMTDYLRPERDSESLREIITFGE